MLSFASEGVRSKCRLVPPGIPADARFCIVDARGLPAKRIRAFVSNHENVTLVLKKAEKSRNLFRREVATQSDNPVFLLK